jgi:hypothetical protein
MKITNIFPLEVLLSLLLLALKMIPEITNYLVKDLNNTLKTN